MLFETAVEAGKKNKVFIPIKKSITLVVAPYIKHGEILVLGNRKKIENGVCILGESDINDQNKITVGLNDSVIEKSVEDNLVFVNFQAIDIILPVLKLEKSGILDLSITDLKDGKCVFLSSGSEAVEILRQAAKHLTENSKTPSTKI